MTGGLAPLEGTADGVTIGELERARSRIAALEQLLETFERASMEQAERLEHARNEVHRILMQAPAAISVLRGPEHLIVSANALYEEIVGGRPVLGRTVREAFPELEGLPFFDLLDRVFATGEAYVGHETPVRLERGGAGESAERFFTFVYQPLTDVSGTVTGIMVHAVDVTDQVLARRQVEANAEALRRLTEALERSNRELDQFAYVTSHDLKAPLRGIGNLAQWIEEDLQDRLDDQSREHMRLLQLRVKRMEALIDGILAYSRAGRTGNRPAPVQTSRLVREVVDLLGLADHDGIHIGGGLPVVLADRVQLQQVLMNLISNAVRHGARDGLRVEISWHPEIEGGAFRVADNGPGISPEFHDRIWGIFQTLQPRDQVESTGIGLALVKKIVESVGGRVWVESDVGRGAAFYFTWPMLTS